MMISKEFRERAWDTLKRKYGKAFLVCLIVDLISFAGISMLNFSQNGAADDVVNPVNRIAVSDSHCIPAKCRQEKLFSEKFIWRGGF